jgi:hypothetical protein
VTIHRTILAGLAGGVIGNEPSLFASALPGFTWRYGCLSAPDRPSSTDTEHSATQGRDSTAGEHDEGLLEDGP